MSTFETLDAPASLAAAGPSAWHREPAPIASWRFELPPDCRVELEAFAAEPTADGAPAPRLPATRAWMRALRERVDGGLGLALVEGVPLAGRAEPEQRRLAATVLGQFGRLVPQKLDGTRVYDVRDERPPPGLRVRRSTTNVSQELHTDGGWLHHTPAYIALTCLKQAPSGGISRLSSLAAAHDTMRETCPDLLARLYRPLCWDRQSEHEPEAARFSREPLFFHDTVGVAGRYYDDYVREGQRLAREPLDAMAEDALETLRELVEAERGVATLRLEEGQMLVLDNRRLLHARTGFEDASVTVRRHLLRIWIRDDGAATLEGR
ncbi:MAG: TauD/TfdA family dioxygenase [Ectothiorhodospiraceae bacterium]|nr:TauD/TfdA family dioxygenase [Ectothiorhodospiraceae bacterium]